MDKEEKKSGCRLEQFCRITGYFQPLSRFNPGKREEVRDRQMYDQRKVKREVQETKDR